MKNILFFLFLLLVSVQAGTIAVYQQDPIADAECAEALKDVLSFKHNVFILTHQHLTYENLQKVDCVAFPGGLGDADNFDIFLQSKKDIIEQYIANGGVYLGVCMGGYFASKHYFNLLGETLAVQYIKQRNASVKDEIPTITSCFWLGKKYSMYFFDGAAFVGDLFKCKVLAKYSNGDAAALIKPYKKGKVIVVGPHTEAHESWFEEIDAKNKWHKGVQYKLLVNAVDLAFTVK